MRSTSPSPRSRFPLFEFLWLLLLGACGLRAQIVHVENAASTPYAGWVRCTVDVAPPYAIGSVRPLLLPGEDGKAATYVVGRRVGLDTTTLDLRVSLAAGERRAFDLSQSSPAPWPWPKLPPDAIAYIGGWPTVAGVPLVLTRLDVDGDAILTGWRARIGAMFVVDVFVAWRPDQPGWCRGEAVITASNPAVPDVSATTPSGLALHFGDASTLVAGLPENAPLVAAGTVFADGQARAVPFVLRWSRLIPDGNETGVNADAAGLVNAVGISHVVADGNPVLPPTFNARQWADGLVANSVARLHSWTVAPLGPNAASGDTGEQEDEVFKGAEPLLHERAMWPCYVCALQMAKRPCHHREANGDLLNDAGHTVPRLVLWDGRAHPHQTSTGAYDLSPDQLGKPHSLQPADCSGWWGPDVEHALFNRLAASARLTGSPALQLELAAIARVYEFQWTVQPGIATTQAYASRAVGWEGILAVHLWRELEDRALAERVRARWSARWSSVLRPALQGKTFWPDGFAPTRVSLWQQAVGAYGVDLAGRVFGISEARVVALAGARGVLQFGYGQDQNGRWITFSTNLLPSGVPEPGSTNIFYLFGFPMAPATVLRSQPADVVASSIWTQTLQDATLPKHTGWLAPGPVGAQ